MPSTPAVTSVVALADQTEYDTLIDAKFFGLQVDAMASGKWADAAKILPKLGLSYSHGAANLHGMLPSFLRRVDAAARVAKNGSLASAVLTKSFAVAMCMFARTTLLEDRALNQQLDSWRSDLEDAHSAVCISLKAFAEVTAAAEALNAPPADRVHIFCMLPAMLTKYRSVSQRCAAAGISVHSAAATGALKSFFRHVTKAVGARHLHTADTPPPRVAAVACARIIAELVMVDGVTGVDALEFAPWFSANYADEIETRVILNFRVGEAALTALQAQPAAVILGDALVASCRGGANADNESRLAIVETLVAAKLVVGEVPPPELFSHYRMPELEDVSIAFRSANLTLFDRSLKANAAWLLARGLLLPVSEARPRLLLQMLVRYFLETCTDFRIDLQQFRSFYSGQFDGDFDVTHSVVIPLLLQGAVVGYLSGDTLVLSKKDPFPGLPLTLLATVSTSMSPNLTAGQPFEGSPRQPPPPMAMPA